MKVIVYFSNNFVNYYSERINNMVKFVEGWKIVDDEREVEEIESAWFYSNDNIYVFNNYKEAEIFYLNKKVKEMEKNGYIFYFPKEYEKLKNKLKKMKLETPEYFV